MSVKVPEGGWRDGDAVVIWGRRAGAISHEALTFRRDRGRWPHAADDAWANDAVASGRVIYVHAPDRDGGGVPHE